MTDEYVNRCPACGDVIDYCQGHGAIGDPAGRAILDAHDSGEHSGCHPDGCEERPQPVTAYAVALARGIEKNELGNYSAAEFERVGIPIWGGCQTCHESLAAYNAYPSKTGFWQCDDHIGDRGFATVEEFERFTEAEDG